MEVDAGAGGGGAERLGRGWESGWRRPRGSRRGYRARRSLRSLGAFVRSVFKSLLTLAPLAGDRGGGGRTGGGGGGVEGEDGGGDEGDREGSSRAERGDDYDDGGFRESEVNEVKTPPPAGSGGKPEPEAPPPSWPLPRGSGLPTPGALGLKNHGNTCFMNAVLQCLSNTELLAEYLGLEQYRAAAGTGRDQPPPPGPEVTAQLAVLVRALWTRDYTPQLSVRFKNIVAKYGSQFRGNSQHDALEFLLWLLDRVHEDINSSPNKKSRPHVKSSSVGDENVMGAQQPAQQTGNQSFVQELFQAQYRSSLTCPHCLKQSNTFDPFLCLSLPIPPRQTRALSVTLVLQPKNLRYLRTGFAVPLLGTVADLRELVAQEGKIPADEILLAEVYPSGFERSFSDEEDLNTIAEGDCVYAFQAPSSRGAGSARMSGRSQSTVSDGCPTETVYQGTKVLLLICNVAGSGTRALRFGPPFLVREDRSISWDQLQGSLLSKLSHLMRSEARRQNTASLFRIRVVGTLAINFYLSPQDSCPLQHPAVTRVLDSCVAAGPCHVKLVVEWDQRVKEELFGSIQEEVVQDAESVRVQQQRHQEAHSCTLAQCFQLYTQEEQLAPDDAWRCPHCNILQQGTVKLNLWTLPDILVIHLKRFRQVGERRTKLSTLVTAPLCGLDMSPHLVKRPPSTKSFLSHWSPWKRPRSPGDNYVYDMYAVCNHHGSMQGGHYTASCRNSVDGLWYNYDDSNVEVIPETEVCTRAAYILFYQRRNSIPAWSANTSVAGSTSSSVSDHWLYRLTGEDKRGSLVSRASTNCTSLPSSPESPVFPENPLSGAVEPRPFARGTRGRSVSMKAVAPTVPKEPGLKSTLRWSLGSKDRPGSVPGALVEYLESGRRPRCTTQSIVPRMTLAADALSSQPERQSAEGTKQPPGGGSTEAVGARIQESSRDLPHSRSHETSTASERTSSLKRSGKRRNSGSQQQRNSSTLGPNKASGARNASQGKSEDSLLREDGNSKPSDAVRIGSVSSLALNDTLKRSRGQSGSRKLDELRSTAPEAQGQAEAGSRCGAGEEPRLNDRMRSFLKSSFLKKDTKRQCDPEKLKPGDHERPILTAALPNGALNRQPGGEQASEISPRPGAGEAKHREMLSSGRRSLSEELRRSRSSSSIEATGWRRTGSLVKNGPSCQQPKHPTVDRGRSATLQRTRFSSASLGRRKPVPESSF